MRFIKINSLFLFVQTFAQNQTISSTIQQKLTNSAYKIQPMHRSHHSGFSLQNCIMMENRLPLVFVPKHFTTYFINSKRRFFLYFKHRDEMEQVIRIFQKQNVRFYPRKSMFPDREQQQEIVFHCNYKYKKKDLRWALHRETKLREPINRFNEYRNNLRRQTSKNYNFEPVEFVQDKIKLDILQPVSSKTQILINKEVVQMQMEETAPEFIADFGQIKVKNPEILNIINDINLIKALFRAEKKKS